MFPIDIWTNVYDYLDLSSLIIIYKSIFNRSTRSAIQMSHLWYKFVDLYVNIPIKIDINWRDVVLSLSKLSSLPTKPLLSRAVDASSTDHYHQNISNTMNKNGETFWSSSGTASEDSVEYLSYELNEPICLVKSIDIAFYKATYHPGGPIYSSKKLRVILGFNTDLDEQTNGCFVSQEFDVKMTDKIQHFEFPYFIPCHYVRIELIGKLQAQYSDNLYYSVVASLDIKGHGLSLTLDNKCGSLSHNIMKICLYQPTFWNYLDRFLMSKDEIESPYPAFYKLNAFSLIHMAIRYRAAFIPLNTYHSDEIVNLIQQVKSIRGNVSQISDDWIDNMVKCLTVKVVKVIEMN